MGHEEMWQAMSERDAIYANPDATDEDYMRAAEPGRTVIGRGECYKLTRTIAFIRGIAHDGDPADPVAHVTGTFMATHGTYL